MSRMSKRVALVTGGSSGIGEETARALREAGFEVYAVARRVDRMAGLEAARRPRSSAMDVTDDASMVAGVERIVAEHGPDRRTRQQRRLRLVRRGRGRADRRGAAAVRGQRLRPGPAHPARHAAHARRRQPRPDHQHLLDRRRSSTSRSGAWYHATKFAVEGFSDSLRLELRPFGIDVVIIEPGPIRTEWNKISRDSLVESSAGAAPTRRWPSQVARVHGARRHSRLLSSGPETVGEEDREGRAAREHPARRATPSAAAAGTIVPARKLLPDRGVRRRSSRAYLRDAALRRRRPSPARRPRRRGRSAAAAGGARCAGSR